VAIREIRGFNNDFIEDYSRFSWTPTARRRRDRQPLPPRRLHPFQSIMRRVHVVHRHGHFPTGVAGILLHFFDDRGEGGVHNLQVLIQPLGFFNTRGNGKVFHVCV
jgi:hypothetical protein